MKLEAILLISIFMKHTMMNAQPRESLYDPSCTGTGSNHGNTLQLPDIWRNRDGTPWNKLNCYKFPNGSIVIVQRLLDVNAGDWNEQVHSPEDWGYDAVTCECGTDSPPENTPPESPCECGTYQGNVQFVNYKSFQNGKQYELPICLTDTSESAMEEGEELASYKYECKLNGGQTEIWQTTHWGGDEPCNGDDQFTTLVESEHIDYESTSCELCNHSSCK